VSKGKVSFYREERGMGLTASGRRKLLTTSPGGGGTSPPGSGKSAYSFTADLSSLIGRKKGPRAGNLIHIERNLRALSRKRSRLGQWGKSVG